MEQLKKFVCLDATVLKSIALVCMLLDHIGYIFFPELTILRMFGRLTLPIFAFFVAEGYEKTRSVPKYALRLLVFALISEFPFDFAINRAWIDMSSQNVFFTLLFGLGALWSADTIKAGKNWKTMLLGAAGLLACVALPIVLQTDYSIYGVLMVVLFSMLKNKWWGPIVSVGAANGLMLISQQAHWRQVQATAFVAVLPLLLYNGERGRGMKWLFYAFYPAHLLVLGVIYFLPYWL